MKILDTIAKVVLCLICIMPIMGAVDIFPPPTRDLYNTDLAFEFIQMLMAVMYINYAMGAISIVSVALIIMKRTALALLLLAPVTFNVVAFHLFIDGGLFTMGASLGNVLMIAHAYLLWRYRAHYQSLWKKD